MDARRAQQGVAEQLLEDADPPLGPRHEDGAELPAPPAQGIVGHPGLRGRRANRIRAGRACRARRGAHQDQSAGERHAEKEGATGQTAAHST